MSAVIRFMTSACALIFVLWCGNKLPQRVASHFDFAGIPDDYMSRSTFISFMLALLIIVPLMIGLFVSKVIQLKGSRIPNRDHWLSETNAAETYRYMDALGSAFGATLTIFLAYVFYVVVEANAEVSSAAGGQKIGMQGLLIALVLFLVAVGVAIASLHRHFQKS